MVPVFPTAHYAMGGIPTNIETEVLADNDQVVPGLYAAGEVACVSVHGANRLRGPTPARHQRVRASRRDRRRQYAKTVDFAPLPEDPEALVRDQLEGLLTSTGTERVVDIRRALQETMDMNAQVYRTEATLKQALSDVQELRERFRNVSVQDKGKRYNTDLLETVELGFLLELAEVVVVGALARKSPVADTPARTTRPVTT